MLKQRFSLLLVLALCVCVAGGGFATLAPAASHKKKAPHLLKTIPKSLLPLLKDCNAHKGKLRHRYSKSKKRKAVLFLERYDKTQYVGALSACERNMAKQLHIKLPGTTKHKKRK